MLMENEKKKERLLKGSPHEKKIYTLFDTNSLFKEEEESCRHRAKLSFEEKIKILVDLQKLARNWGERKNVIIWKL